MFENFGEMLQDFSVEFLAGLAVVVSVGVWRLWKRRQGKSEEGRFVNNAPVSNQNNARVEGGTVYQAGGDIYVNPDVSDEVDGLLKQLRVMKVLRKGERIKNDLKGDGGSDDEEAARKFAAEASPLVRQEFGRLVEKWRNMADSVCRLDPDLGARAWFSAGFLLKETGDILSLVVEAYDRSIPLWDKSNPNKGFALNNRGNARAALGDYAGACEDIRRGISLVGDDWEKVLLANLANVFIRWGRHEDAIESCDKALEMWDEYADAYTYRGLAKEGLGDYRDALKDFDEAIRLKSGCADAHRYRGCLHLQQRRLEEARRDLERAVSLASGPDDWLGKPGVDKHLSCLLRAVGEVE